MSVLTIIVEGVMALLMLALIVYCVKLNRGLAAIRGQDEQIGTMIAELDSAAERAEASVARLKSAGLQAEASLRSAIRDGEKLRTALKPQAQQGSVWPENQSDAAAEAAVEAALFRNDIASGAADRSRHAERPRDPSRNEAEATVLQAIRAARGGE